MTATTFLLLAAAVSVALLLVLHLRLNRRQEALHLRMVGFEQARKSGSHDVLRRIDETGTQVAGIEEALSGKYEAFEGRLRELEEDVLPALAALEEMGEATEAAEELKTAKARFDEITAAAEARFQGLRTGLDDAAERLTRIEKTVEKTLEDRLAAVERRLISIRAGTAWPAPGAAPSGGTPAARRPAGAAPDGDGPARSASLPAASLAATTAAPEPVRVEEAGFTYEGEAEAPGVPAIRGLLLLVAMLAGLMMLFHWLGVGR